MIKGSMPSVERVEFRPYRNEANMLAIRLARIFTGRRKILRFEESYHGLANELAPPAVPGIVNYEVKIIPSHDLNRVEEELANVALFLVSDEASYIIGQNIVLDGGVTLTSI